MADDLQAPAPKSLADYVEILLRRIWLTLGIFGLVLLAAAIVTVRTKPLYSATSSMVLGTESYGDIALDERKGASRAGLTAPQIAYHVELLQSWSLRRKVAGLIPDSIVEQFRTSPLLARNAPGASSSEASLSSDALALVAQTGIAVRPVRDVNVVRISVSAPSPRLAVLVANAYVEAYQEYSLDQSRTDVSAARRFIEEQLNVVRSRLDSVEKVIEEFKRNRNVVDVASRVGALASQQAGIAVAYRSAVTERQIAEAQLTSTRTRLEQEGKGTSQKLEGISSPMVASLKATLDQLEVDKANLIIQGYPDSSPRVQELEKQVADIRSQLAKESRNLVEQQGFIEPVSRLKELYLSTSKLEADYEAAQTREEMLGNALANADAALRALPATERAYARLSRDLETDRRVYAMLSERWEEVRIQEAGRVAPVRVLDRAPGAVKVKPNMRSNLGLGLILALAIGIGVAFGVEYLDTSLRTPQDLERRGLPVLATIPLLRANRTGPRDSIKAHLLLYTDAESSGAEDFRVLRTSILFGSIDRNVRALAVTSAAPSEGKSTVAANLATVLAQAGHRTLLVDADLRGPVVHSIFDRPKKPGLTDLVAFGGDSDQTVFPTAVDNLYGLTCGTQPPSPADLISSSAFSALLERLRQRFDYVILDCPPLLVAADAAVMSAKVDATLLVVRAGKSKSGALDHARKVLYQARVRTMGAVLNGLRLARGQGRRYYYYYHYDGYGKERRRKRRAASPENAGE